MWRISRMDTVISFGTVLSSELSTEIALLIGVGFSCFHSSSTLRSQRLHCLAQQKSLKSLNPCLPTRPVRLSQPSSLSTRNPLSITWAENILNLLYKPPPPNPVLVTSSVQSLSYVRLFATPWTAARQASLSITKSQSLLKLMSIEPVMPSNHFIGSSEEGSKEKYQKGNSRSQWNPGWSFSTTFPFLRVPHHRDWLQCNTAFRSSRDPHDERSSRGLWNHSHPGSVG